MTIKQILLLGSTTHVFATFFMPHYQAYYNAQYRPQATQQTGRASEVPAAIARRYSRADRCLSNGPKIEMQVSRPKHTCQSEAQRSGSPYVQSNELGQVRYSGDCIDVLPGLHIEFLDDDQLAVSIRTLSDRGGNFHRLHKTTVKKEADVSMIELMRAKGSGDTDTFMENALTTTLPERPWVDIATVLKIDQFVRSLTELMDCPLQALASDYEQSCFACSNDRRDIALELDSLLRRRSKIIHDLAQDLGLYVLPSPASQPAVPQSLTRASAAPSHRYEFDLCSWFSSTDPRRDAMPVQSLSRSPGYPCGLSPQYYTCERASVYTPASYESYVYRPYLGRPASLPAAEMSECSPSPEPRIRAELA